MKKLAVQLYSLRDYLDDGVEPMLQAVKDCGFTGVEFASYYEMPTSELRALLDKIGLEAYSSHVPLDRLKNETQQVLEEALDLGLEYVICPWSPMDSEEAIKDTADVLNQAHALFAPHGIKIGYHNHAKEFEKIDEIYKEDILHGAFAHNDMLLQLDTCWLRYAGVDPLTYIKQKVSSLAPLHFKELGQKDDGSFDLEISIGEGIIDFPAILSFLAEEDLLDLPVIIEQEHFSSNPYQSLKSAVDYLKNNWPK